MKIRERSKRRMWRVYHTTAPLVITCRFVVEEGMEPIAPASVYMGRYGEKAMRLVGSRLGHLEEKVQRRVDAIARDDDPVHPQE